MLEVRIQARQTLDDRNRLAVPSALKKACDVHRVRSLVLTVYGESIWGVAPDTAKALEEKLATLDPFSEEALDFAHAVLGPTEEVEFDGQNRLRIPSELCELVGIQREVHIISLLDRIEIWEPEAWKRRMREAQQRVSARKGMPRQDLAAPALAVAGEGT